MSRLSPRQSGSPASPILGILLLTLSLCGCISSPTARDFEKIQLGTEVEEKFAKEFHRPPPGWAGLYLIRPGFWIGSAVNFFWYVDGNLAGKTANDTFLYRLVRPGEHKVRMQFWNGASNILSIHPAEGENVFICSTIFTGFFSDTHKIFEKRQEEAKALAWPLGLVRDEDRGTQVSPFDPKGSIPAIGYRQEQSPPPGAGIRHLPAESVQSTRSDVAAQSDREADQSTAVVTPDIGEDHPKLSSGKLEQFHAKGLISDAEYEALKKDPASQNSL